jgi:hypothetical protein
MYSKRRDPLGCQAAGIWIGPLMLLGAGIVWAIGRVLEWLANL